VERPKAWTGNGSLIVLTGANLLPIVGCCFGIGVFVFVLLGGKRWHSMGRSGPFKGMAEMIGQIVHSGAFWFVLAIIGSHLFSFATNYLGKGEFRRMNGAQLMAAPYGRIVVLHIAILFGAFATMAFGNSVFLLILLIIGKIIIDAKFHLRCHSKIAVKPKLP
jgi:hypothetical protein